MSKIMRPKTPFEFCAYPVLIWDFLAKRISAQYLRPVTMGSLFDGIGGFPLVFERHNGKDTARWASEIEEFPIAVTKLRFGEG